MFHGEIASQLKWRGLPEEGKSSPHFASDCQSRAEAKRLHHPFPIRIREVASTASSVKSTTTQVETTKASRDDTFILTNGIPLKKYSTFLRVVYVK